MADVYLGRFNRGVEKLFNVKGGPTTVDINHQIGVTFELPIGSEERYLFGWNRFGSAINAPAVAAQNSAIQFRNPPTSGVIGVIERLSVNLLSALTRSQIGFRYGTGVGDFTTIVNGIALDHRQQTGSPLITSAGTIASFVNTFLVTAVNSGLDTAIISTVNQEINLMPGDFIVAYDNTVNEAITVNILWRERAIESSESS